MYFYKMKNLSFLALLLFSFFVMSCNDDENIIEDIFNFPETALINTESDRSFDQTAADLEAAITANGFNLVTTVDHAAAAAGAGLMLPPTKVMIFGNPMGGTQFMQQDQRVGIDLPLKVLLWEAPDNSIQISYYNAETITDRYDIDDLDDLISDVNQKLATITGSGNPEEEGELLDAALFLKNKETDKSFDEVYNTVRTEVTSRGFTVVQEVDHAAAAAAVNMELRPTKVIIFGNPEGGTQLMQAERQIAIDLPLKILVWEEEDGDVNVSHYSADFLARRYDIDSLDDLRDNVDEMLEAIVDAATE